MIRGVIITVIPHHEQRYDTVGDWQLNEVGCLFIRISDTGVWFYNLAIAIHELVEATLCVVMGINEKVVDEFDITFEGQGEPGDDPTAPYHLEHVSATLVERIVINHAKIPWPTYNDFIDNFTKENTMSFKPDMGDHAKPIAGTVNNPKPTPNVVNIPGTVTTQKEVKDNPIPGTVSQQHTK